MYSQDQFLTQFGNFCFLQEFVQDFHLNYRRLWWCVYHRWYYWRNSGTEIIERGEQIDFKNKKILTKKKIDFLFILLKKVFWNKLWIWKRKTRVNGNIPWLWRYIIVQGAADPYSLIALSLYDRIELYNNRRPNHCMSSEEEKKQYFRKNVPMYSKRENWGRSYWFSLLTENAGVMPHFIVLDIISSIFGIGKLRTVKLFPFPWVPQVSLNPLAYILPWKGSDVSNSIISDEFEHLTFTE